MPARLYKRVPPNQIWNRGTGQKNPPSHSSPPMSAAPTSGRNFGAQPKVRAESHDHQKFVVNRPAITRDVVGLCRSGRLRVLEVFIERHQTGNLVRRAPQNINGLAAPLDNDHLPRV